MAIPQRHGLIDREGNGSRSVASGHIEGKAWDIEQLGLGYKVVFEGGGFDVSTPVGRDALRDFIEDLRFYILGES